MPPALNLVAPVDALRKELPTRPDDAVRAGWRPTSGSLGSSSR